jgi:hypothetical protein
MNMSIYISFVVTIHNKINILITGITDQSTLSVSNIFAGKARITVPNYVSTWEILLNFLFR